MGRLIGVFGGTFDPPHLGHLILAEQAREALDLERVLWVLTPKSPLKADGDRTPPDVRARMVEAAIADAPTFALSRVDLDRQPPYYAVGTLERLRLGAPEDSFVYLIGSDSLADLPRWHEPQRLVGLCAAIGVMQRPDHPLDLPALERVIPGLSAKVRAFPAPLVEVSGRDLRARVASGRSIRYLVPDGVRRIIDADRLYRQPGAR